MVEFSDFKVKEDKAAQPPVNLVLVRAESEPLIEGAVVLPLPFAESPIVFDRLRFRRNAAPRCCRYA